MKRVFPYLLVLLMIGLIVSCHKDPIPNHGGNEQPVDTIPIGNDTIPINNDTIPFNNDTIPINNDTIPINNDTIPFETDIIHFGDTMGMIVSVPDGTSYNGNYGIGYFSIDVNNDGAEDAQLITQDVGSAGLGHENVITLKCKNRRIAWFGEAVQQELYYHADSTSWYYVDPDYPQFDSIHVIHIDQIHTCERIAETDSTIQITEKFFVFDNNNGDELKKSDYFENADVVLRNRSYEIGYEPTGWGTSTLMHVTYHQRNNCDYFPLREEKYIGFKYTNKDNTERLGWIKIIISYYYDYGAQLLETAIQK